MSSIITAIAGLWALSAGIITNNLAAIGAGTLLIVVGLAATTDNNKPRPS